MNKKIISLTLIAVAAVALTSCGEKSGTLENEFSIDNSNASNLTEFTGVLQRVEANDNSLTHPTQYLFISNNGSDNDMYLTSSSMTLDKFLNEEIVIRGYFTDKEKGIFFVADANLKSSNMNSNMAMGRTYSNNTMGVSFVYPSTWSVTENDASKITVSANGNTVFTLYKVGARSGESLTAWIKRNYPSGESSDFQIGLLVGSKIESDSSTTIAFSANSSIYSMTRASGTTDAAIEREYAELQTSLRTFTPGSAPTASTTDTNTSQNTNSTTTEISSDGVISPSTSSMTNKNTNIAGSSNTAQPSAGNESNSSSQVAVSAPEVVSYIKSNTQLLPATGTVKVSKVELAGDKYAYVTYMDGTTPKKVLFELKKGPDNISVAQVGAFEQGTTQSWVTVSGSNPAANTARDVYNISSEGSVTSKTSVSQGNSLYTNNQLGFQVQYPKNWYYSGENISAEGGLQKVTFSNKPAGEEAEEKVEMKIYPKGKLDVSGATTTTVGGQKAYVIKDESGNQQYAVQGSDGRMYVTGSNGSAGGEKAMTDIIKSLEAK